MRSPIKKVYRAYDEMFVNSKALVIEYHDVLRAQWFATLQCVAVSDALDQYFDTTMLRDMETASLFEWYIMRKHRNFLMDLPCKHVFPSEEEKEKTLDKFLFDIGQIPGLYGRDVTLNFSDTLSNLIQDGRGMVRHYYVYGGLFKDPLLEAQVKQDYTSNVDFIYGDFITALEGINKDATYVISDINKLADLSECGRLNYASVLISDGYRYNFLEDKEDGLKVDVKMVLDNNTCRLSFFDNLTQPELVDEEGRHIDPASGRILEFN